MLHTNDAKSNLLAKALMDEFHVMSTLRHPNVLLTLGIAEDSIEGTKGIVMELMEASLADVINLAAFQLYSSWEGSFFSIARDAANGMAYIHFNNMLHRDLKPGNVLLDAQWVAKIADFGSTFNSAANQAGKDGGDIQGTPPYMAPEIVQNKVYDTPADVWAFGCLLAHMGSKRAPYSWLTHIETPKQLFLMAHLVAWNVPWYTTPKAPVPSWSLNVIWSMGMSLYSLARVLCISAPDTPGAFLRGRSLSLRR